MSRRYPGRLMGLVASKGTNAASGIWTLKDMRDYCATGKWPGSGGSTPPAAPPGGDPLYSYVRGLYHLDSEITAGASTFEYQDTSLYGVRLRNAGGASFVTNQSKYGGGSVLFPYAGSTAYLFSTASLYATATSGIYSIGSADDFTVEAWVFAASQTTQKLTLLTNCDPSVATQRGFSLYLQYFLYWGFNSGAGQVSGAIPYSQWTHVAASRSGGTLRLFVDGVVQATLADSSSYAGDAYTFLVGGGPGAGGFGGWLDDVRITIGTGVGAGRYTANFTPPSAPFPDAL